ncbi:MAG: hypothetical protein H8E48_10910 [Chloroflexi bacterium]|nr:hypothetical protein [Chloroflexota bacterium]
MNWFRLKNCIKCQGDLASDEGDWICLQCGTYYYTGLYQVHSQVDDSLQTPASVSPIVDAAGLSQPERKTAEAVRSPLLQCFTKSNPLGGFAPRTTVVARMGAVVAS